MMETLDYARGYKMMETLDYARTYALYGWPVFRIRSGSKVPLDRWVTGGPHDAATTDPDEIARRWRPHSSSSPHNIGIATGRDLPSGGYLTVLDLDMDEPDFAGRPEWAKPTYEVRTPSGGLHLYYRTAEPVSSRRIAPGMDVKSRGGMVLAPPSTINGRSYQVVESRPPVFMDHDLFSPVRVLSSSHGAELAQPLAERMSFRPADQVGEGGRDTYLARYAGWWLNNADDDYAASIVEGKPATEPTEYDLAVELDYHNLMVCQPPLPERDVQRIARSIYAKHLRNA